MSRAAGLPPGRAHPHITNTYIGTVTFLPGGISAFHTSGGHMRQSPDWYSYQCFGIFMLWAANPWLTRISAMHGNLSLPYKLWLYTLHRAEGQLQRGHRFGLGQEQFSHLTFLVGNLSCRVCRDSGLTVLIWSGQHGKSKKLGKHLLAHSLAAAFRCGKQ